MIRLLKFLKIFRSLGLKVLFSKHKSTNLIQLLQHADRLYGLARFLIRLHAACRQIVWFGKILNSTSCTMQTDNMVWQGSRFEL